jgi:hypothetical protein
MASLKDMEKGVYVSTETLSSDNYYKWLKDAISSSVNISRNTNDIDCTDKGEEEWIWVEGYKGTDKNMQCNGYQYELGKQSDMAEGEPILMCSSGFHFCDKLNPVYRYYEIKNGNRFFEVKALVRRWKKDGYYRIEQQNDKMVSKSIQFVRELTIDEIFDAVNDVEVKNWTTEKKELARQTSIENVKNINKIEKLVSVGYSEAFATYVCNKEPYAFDFAYTMGMTPDVSMDIKILTVCMKMFD